MSFSHLNDAGSSQQYGDAPVGKRKFRVRNVVQLALAVIAAVIFIYLQTSGIGGPDAWYQKIKSVLLFIVVIGIVFPVFALRRNTGYDDDEN